MALPLIGIGCQNIEQIFDLKLMHKGQYYPEYKSINYILFDIDESLFGFKFISKLQK